MATLSPPPVQERRRLRPLRWLLALLCSFIIGAAALILFLREATVGMWNDVATTLSNRTVRIDTSQPTVVARIQRLQRLETVTYTMDKIVEGEREGRVLPPILTGDKLLLVAHGQAIAGVELDRLAKRDVEINGRSVHLHLPPSQIFAVALDNEQSRVYSRETGLFVPVDPNLESEVRAKAEEDLRQSALAAGILNTAHQNACGTLRTLLLNLGFEQVQCD
jgi:Protein of unknown function (DUF4230)